MFKTLKPFAFLSVFLISFSCSLSAQTLKDALQPAVKKGGFKMEGFILWCPSVIKVGNTYHMFASRWPEQYGLGGWTKYSEIVRATSDNLYGPYTFQEVVLQKREGFWDNDRAHNPKIVKSGNTFVLYYISSANETGYAYSNAITGPWKRVDSVAMPFSNPAPLVKKDGSVYVFGRKSINNIRIAQGYTAPAFNAPYSILNEGKNLLPGMNQLEDPTIWWASGQYNVILSDFGGEATGVKKNGAQYYSTDGIQYRAATAPAPNHQRSSPWVPATEPSSTTVSRYTCGLSQVSARHGADDVRSEIGRAPPGRRRARPVAARRAASTP